jgi:hypothetical protein
MTVGIECRACGAFFAARSYEEARGRTCGECRARAQGFVGAVMIAAVASAVVVAVVLLLVGVL